MNPYLIALVAVVVVFVIIFLLVSLREWFAKQTGVLPRAGTATMADVERLKLAGQKIWAIRCYREVHKCGLAEAKRAVESMPMSAAGMQSATEMPVAGQAIPAELEQLIRTGQTIAAIRRYREIHNVGLAEAKQVVDDLALRLRR
jgi:ribosomal protein L7/L12